MNKENCYEIIEKTASYWRKNYDTIISERKEKAVCECNYNYMVYLAFYAEAEAITGHFEEAKKALLDLGGFRDEFIERSRLIHRDIKFPVNNAEFPVLEPRFSVSHYMKAVVMLNERGLISSDEYKLLEEYSSSAINQAFAYLDWGTHNRGIMRAFNLALAAKSFPDNENAQLWKKIADGIMSDNFGQWSIEDTPNYFPLWLHDMFEYTEMTGEENRIDKVKIKYYLDMLVKLFNPLGYITDYGDDIESVKTTQIAVLEYGAKMFGCGQMKYVANRLFDGLTQGDYSTEPMLRAVATLLDACKWADDSIAEEKPQWLSCEVMDDLVGKKILFASDDTYMLLNYKDEGSYGYLTRNFLNTTLTVRPEKMHHGHSDENSIVCLVQDGIKLLGDGGYRELENPIGEYRADYYHNSLIVREKTDTQKLEKIENVLENACKTATCESVFGEDTDALKLYYSLVNKEDTEKLSPLSQVIDFGEYEQVVSEKLFFYKFDEFDVSRTRIHKETCICDRVIVWLREEKVFAVTDIVKFKKDGFYTAFPMFYPENESLKISFCGEGEEYFGKMKRRSSVRDVRYFAQQRHFYKDEIIVFNSILSTKDVDASFKDGVLQINNKYNIINCKNTDILYKETDKRPAYNFESDAVKYGDFETDAMFLLVKTAENNDILDYSIINATGFVYKGKKIFGELPVANYNEFNRVQGWKFRTGDVQESIYTYWNKFNDIF